MLRKHFIMSGDGKPDFTITYHAPKHVPFFGGYAKNWVYGNDDRLTGDFIKFKVIGDKWNNGVGEWKFKLEDSSNRIYNSIIMNENESNYEIGFADYYIKHIFDGNIENVIESTIIDNSNIITSVIFGEGIETINGSVLHFLSSSEEKQSSCTSITLPESVTLLTGNLFDEYTSLKTITVPLNVIRIDNLCNIDGDSLEEVVLKPLTPPDASNTSKQAPLGVHSNNGENSSKIRVYADCIDVYKNDSIWGLYSDLYDTINNVIVYYDGDRKLYTKNLDITSINYGMIPKSITNVYLPNSVTSIGNGAFHHCNLLTSVEIGNLVTSIGSSAFPNCSGLTSIVWNAVNCSDFGLSYPSGSPFYNIRTQITSFEIGDSVEHIPDYMCYEMSNLTSVEIGNSVTSIGWLAFYGCSGLTSVVIGNSVTSIGDEAFYGCSGITSIVWNSVNHPDFSFSDYNPFYNIRTQITSFEFGDSIEYIPKYMCFGMSNLTSVVIPDSVTSIGESAFSYCPGLTSITIPNSVTSIEDYAFRDCSGLTSVVIGNLVTSIGYGAFKGCTELTSVEIPNSVNSIGELAFTDCVGLTSVVIPNSVTSIGYGTFKGCTGLTSVVIPNSVTDIGNSAFDGCTELTSVVIGNLVTSIGVGAFLGCTGLTSVAIPNSVTSIYGNAFLGCTGLTSVEIGNSVTSIGSYAFDGCSGLTSITITDSVTSIEEYTFRNCDGLTSVVIGNSVTSIGVCAFYSCSGLTSIVIPNSVTSIGNRAFHHCNLLTSVEIGNLVTIIGVSAFSNCSGLTSITIPDSVTSIGDEAFYYCTGLTSVVIGNSVNSIGDEAFYYCTGLTSFTITTIVPPTLGSGMFYKTPSNLIIYVPDESVDAYKSATNWSSYSSKIKPISEKPV